jgi:hypothetical protein
MRPWILGLVGCLCWVLVVAPASAFFDLVLPEVEFAAVAVHEAGPIRTEESIYYAKGRLRIDRGKGFASTILDFTTQTQCLLMANHTYLIMPMDSELLRRYIAPAPETSGARKTGKERVLGQETTKYAFGDDGPLRATGFFWLTSTGILLRREYHDGIRGEDVHHLDMLTNIKIEKQPASLFSIPTGYRLAR